MEDQLKSIDKIHKNEVELIKKLIQPLFEKMPFEKVYYTHGIRERGKDLVLVKKNPLGDNEYTAIVVKKGNVNTSVAETIISQLQRAYGSGYKDTGSIKKSYSFNSIYVIASGLFIDPGKEAFVDGLREDIKKLTRLIDGKDLINLINDHWPDYFFPDKLEITNYLKNFREELVGSSSLPLNDPSIPRTLLNVWVEPPFRIMNYSSSLRKKITHSKDLTSKFLSLNQLRDNGNISLDIIRSIFKGDFPISFVFEGPAGIGKSSILKILLYYLAIDSNKSSKMFPIYIKLREFGNSDLLLQEYIKNQLEEYAICEAVYEKCSNENTIILGLDGLDEVLLTESKTEVVRKINDYLSLNPNTCLIIATRDSQLITKDYFEDNIDHVTIKINHLKKEKIKEFIKNWTSSIERTTERFTKIRADPKILEIASRPLILTLLMILLDQNKPLPQRRALVYNECVRTFLDWDRMKGMQSDSQIEKKIKVLTGLAHNYYEEKLEKIEIRSIKNRISEVFILDGKKDNDSINEILEEIKRSEIIIPNHPDGFNFLYQSFNEFLLAKFLYDNNKADFLLNRYYDSRLHEVILLYAGLSEAERNPMLDLLSKNDDILYRRRLILYELVNEIGFSIETQEKVKEICKEVVMWKLGFYPIIPDNMTKYLSEGEEFLRFLICLTNFTLFGSINNSVVKQFLDLIGKLDNHHVCKSLLMRSLEISFYHDLKQPINKNDLLTIFINSKMIENQSFSIFIDKIKPLLSKDVISPSEIITLWKYIAENFEIDILLIYIFIIRVTVINDEIMPDFNMNNPVSRLLNLLMDIRYESERDLFLKHLEDKKEVIEGNLFSEMRILMRLNTLIYFSHIYSKLKWESFLENIGNFSQIDFFYHHISAKSLLEDRKSIKRRLKTNRAIFLKYTKQKLNDIINSKEGLQNIVSMVLKDPFISTYALKWTLSERQYSEYLELMKERLKKLPDNDFINLSNIFEEIEYGKERLTEIIKSSSPDTKNEIRKMINSLTVISDSLNDSPIFVNELSFDLLIDPSERVFYSNLLKMKTFPNKEWLDKKVSLSDYL